VDYAAEVLHTVQTCLTGGGCVRGSPSPRGL